MRADCNNFTASAFGSVGFMYLTGLGGIKLVARDSQYPTVQPAVKAIRRSTLRLKGRERSAVVRRDRLRQRALGRSRMRRRSQRQARSVESKPKREDGLDPRRVCVEAEQCRKAGVIATDRIQKVARGIERQAAGESESQTYPDRRDRSASQIDSLQRRAACRIVRNRVEFAVEWIEGQSAVVSGSQSRGESDCFTRACGQKKKRRGTILGARNSIVVVERAGKCESAVETVSGLIESRKRTASVLCESHECCVIVALAEERIEKTGGTIKGQPAVKGNLVVAEGK